MNSAKKIMSFFLILFMIAICTEDLNAQKKRRKSRKSQARSEEVKEPAQWKKNMVYEIGLGNPSFQGGNGASLFTIGLKPSAGYKIASRLTAGVLTKMNFAWYSLGTTEFTFFDYGAGIYSRLKVIDAIYVKGEFAYTSYETVNNFNVLERNAYTDPLLGMGYVSSYGERWNYGVELLFHVKKELRDATGQLGEFWLKFDYNF